MIQTSRMWKYFGAKAALRGLSFGIEAGEVAGLVGRNGAGKTTALNVLSGQMLPSAGDAIVDGCSVVQAPLEVRRRIGFLPEQPPLYPEMTVRGYLRFAARLRGLPAERLGRRLDEVLEQASLTEVARERLGTLSRGYAQRVGIAQAIVHEPPVLLLDEPMAGLDPLQIVHMRDLILTLRRHHTILFSSHILSEITNVCDRVILVDEGVVKAIGSETELRAGMRGRYELTLLVRGEAAPVAELLGRFASAPPEVAAATQVGHVRVRLVAAGDVREQISRACSEAGLGLLELHMEQSGLEQVFLQLLGDRSPGEGGRAA